MACKRSGVRLPLAPPPSRWKLGTQTIRLKRTAANWPVSRWIPPFVNRFRSLIAGRAVSPVPALPWRALQLARRSFVRPDWPPPARPPRGALCRCDDALGGILFRRCRGKGPVWDSYLARVNRDSAGVPQHEGLAGSNFEALQVPIPQSCPAGPAALALLPAPPESLEVPQEAASRAWEEPMSAAWSSTPSPNPATDGAASATASASIPSRGTSINGISRTAGPAKAAACAVAAGQALGSTMMPAPASTAAAMSFLASSSPRVTGDQSASAAEPCDGRSQSCASFVPAIRRHRLLDVEHDRVCPAPARAAGQAILEGRDEEERPPHQVTPPGRSAAIRSGEGPISERMSLVAGAERTRIGIRLAQVRELEQGPADRLSRRIPRLPDPPSNDRDAEQRRTSGNPEQPGQAWSRHGICPDGCGASQGRPGPT